MAPIGPRRSTRGYVPSYRHLEALQHAAHTAINVDTGDLAEYQQLLRSSEGHLWEQSACAEFARLAQGLPSAGIPATQGTNTIHFIPVQNIPRDRKPTYPRIVVADRPQKTQPRRVRLTVGGDQITYPHDVSTKTSSLPTVKILLNSTISTPDARFMSIDIKDFYLNTPMSRYEYMRVPLASIPAAIQEYYKLSSLAHNGNVFVEIRKGMYGLPQAGRLANDALILHLAAHGYHQSSFTPGLFSHITRPISFCLVVDDFGVKYVGRHNAQHLIDTLSAKYSITTDWDGCTYLGLHLDWDYDQGLLDISMPDYVTRALARFHHPTPATPQHAPHASKPIVYGTRSQLTDDPDDSPPLSADRVTRLQQIIGTFLYYARAVDSSMLVALGTLAAAQTRATAQTDRAIHHFLNYAATHPHTAVRFTKSDMILNVHSDASYLSEPQSRSRVGGLFFLSSAKTAQLPAINGAVHVVSNILKKRVASVAEAEVAACFHNAQDACELRTTLAFLGHPQPATPIQTDNKTANGILNHTIKQKRSKAIDMNYYWLRDRVEDKDFEVYWHPGDANFADYFTKHHPQATHTSLRSVYYRDPINVP